MGYASVLWVREQPIRDWLANRGKDAELFQVVGRALLDVTVFDSFASEVRHHEVSADVAGVTQVIVRLGAFHSSLDLAFLLWTGSRLIRLALPTSSQLRYLVRLVADCRSDRYMPPLSKQARDRSLARSCVTPAVLGQQTHTNPLREMGYASIYWINEDFTRQFRRISPSEWPNADVGEAFLSLMLDTWNHEAHRYGITKMGSFLEPECAALVWSLNCLRRLSDVEDVEILRIGEYLEKR